jgi:hypothetical protein
MSGCPPSPNHFSLTSSFSARARQGSKHHRPDHSSLRDWRRSSSRRLRFWPSAPSRTACVCSTARWLWRPSTWPVPCVVFRSFYFDLLKLLHSSSTISSRCHAAPRSHGSASWWSSSIPSRLHAAPWWYVLELSPPNCSSLIITQGCRHSLPMVPPAQLETSLPSLPVATLDLPRLEPGLHRHLDLRVILALAACILIEYG